MAYNVVPPSVASSVDVIKFATAPNAPVPGSNTNDSLTPTTGVATPDELFRRVPVIGYKRLVLNFGPGDFTVENVEEVKMQLPLRGPDSNIPLLMGCHTQQGPANYTVTTGDPAGLVFTATGLSLMANSPFVGGFVTCLTATVGANVGVRRFIASNTATTVTATAAFPGAITIGDTFQLASNVNYVTTVDPAGLVLTSSGMSLTPNALIGGLVIMAAGSNTLVSALASASVVHASVPVRTIVANTATTITVNSAYPNPIQIGDQFIYTSAANETINTVTATDSVSKQFVQCSGLSLSPHQYEGAFLTFITGANAGQQYNIRETSTNLAVPTLSGGILATDTVIPVSGSTTGYNASGSASITTGGVTEQFYYTSITANTSFNGCHRGQFGTTAAAHNLGDAVVTNTLQIVGSTIAGTAITSGDKFIIGLPAASINFGNFQNEGELIMAYGIKWIASLVVGNRLWGPHNGSYLEAWGCEFDLQTVGSLFPYNSATFQMTANPGVNSHYPLFNPVKSQLALTSSSMACYAHDGLVQASQNGFLNTGNSVFRNCTVGAATGSTAILAGDYRNSSISGTSRSFIQHAGFVLQPSRMDTMKVPNAAGGLTQNSDGTLVVGAVAYYNSAGAGVLTDTGGNTSTTALGVSVFGVNNLLGLSVQTGGHVIANATTTVTGTSADTKVGASLLSYASLNAAKSYQDNRGNVLDMSSASASTAASGPSSVRSARGVVTANVAALTGALTSDGVVYATGDIALLAAQSTASQNGPYIINTAGAWTRPLDWQTASVIAGTRFTVSEGTVYANSTWEMTTAAPITVGTTGLAFIQINTPSNVSAINLVGASPVTAIPAQIVRVDPTGGVMIVNLPTIAAFLIGQEIIVKNVGSSVNNVTVTATGGNTIDGAATFVMNTAFETVTLIADGGTNWMLV